MRLRSWLWLLLVLLMGGYAGWRLRDGRALETDLLAMLPKTERNPVAERGVRALAEAMGDRAVLVVGAKEPEEALAAARTLVSDLEASGAFTEVQGAVSQVDPAMVPRFYAPYRASLPSPKSPEGNDAGALARQIQTRLFSPQGASPGLGLAEDPLGRLDAFLAALPLATSRLELRGGFLAMPTPEGLHILVTAGLKGSAFDPEIQTRAMAAVAQAEGRLHAHHAGATLLRTGAVFHAAEARSTAEREVHVFQPENTNE